MYVEDIDNEDLYYRTHHSFSVSADIKIQSTKMHVEKQNKLIQEICISRQEYSIW